MPLLAGSVLDQASYHYAHPKRADDPDQMEFAWPGGALAEAAAEAERRAAVSDNRQYVYLGGGTGSVWNNVIWTDTSTATIAPNW